MIAEGVNVIDQLFTLVLLGFVGLVVVVMLLAVVVAYIPLAILRGRRRKVGRR